MTEKKVRGEKTWRMLAILVLCGLVYYLSFDHGRATVTAKLDRVRAELVSQQEKYATLNWEMGKLQEALADCRQAPAHFGGGDFNLKQGESRLLFENRVVLTLVEAANLENKAVVQLNFIADGKLVTNDIVSGGSLSFTENERQWDLVLTALQTSTASFTLIERRNK